MNGNDPELPGGYQDADFEMRDLEAAGNCAAKGDRTMRRLRSAGHLADAARACSHGMGYQTKSLAADTMHDPRAGQDGFRCSSCGSWFEGADLTLWDLRGRRATVPCEFWGK